MPNTFNEVESYSFLKERYSTIKFPGHEPALCQHGSGIQVPEGFHGVTPNRFYRFVLPSLPTCVIGSPSCLHLRMDPRLLIAGMTEKKRHARQYSSGIHLSGLSDGNPLTNAGNGNKVENYIAQ